MPDPESSSSTSWEAPVRSVAFRAVLQIAAACVSVAGHER